MYLPVSTRISNPLPTGGVGFHAVGLYPTQFVFLVLSVCLALSSSRQGVAAETLPLLAVVRVGRWAQAFDPDARRLASALTTKSR